MWTRSSFQCRRRSHGSICSPGVTEVGSKRLCVTSGLLCRVWKRWCLEGLAGRWATASTQVVQSRFPSSGWPGWLENPCAKGNWKVATTFFSLSTPGWIWLERLFIIWGFNPTQGWQCSLQVRVLGISQCKTRLLCVWHCRVVLCFLGGEKYKEVHFCEGWH